MKLCQYKKYVLILIIYWAEKLGKVYKIVLCTACQMENIQ